MSENQPPPQPVEDAKEIFQELRTMQSEADQRAEKWLNKAEHWIDKLKDG